MEFLTPGEIAQRHARERGVHREIEGGRWLRLSPGQVTDDTTMALALGEVILAQGGRVEPLAVARADTLAATHPEFAWRGRRQDNPGGYIVDTMKAVLQALEASADFETCVVDVASGGGDADTTAAIAGMLAGALYGPGALPERGLRRLETATRAACEDQAPGLVRRSPLAGGPAEAAATRALAGRGRSLDPS